MRCAGRIPQDWAPDGVRLEVDWILNQDLEFGADGEWWTYLLLRPAADRLEYRLELRGGRGLGTDPTNPHTVANNQLMAEKLAAAPYSTTFVVVPDAHTTIGWRDAWSPHLDRLVDAVT